MMSAQWRVTRSPVKANRSIGEDDGKGNTAPPPETPLGVAGRSFLQAPPVLGPGLRRPSRSGQACVRTSALSQKVSRPGLSIRHDHGRQ